MFYLYILYSEILDSYYVGATSNVEERLKSHLQNHKGYTSKAKD
jgi:putative endonuclease